MVFVKLFSYIRIVFLINNLQVKPKTKVMSKIGVVLIAIGLLLSSYGKAQDLNAYNIKKVYYKQSTTEGESNEAVIDYVIELNSDSLVKFTLAFKNAVVNNERKIKTTLNRFLNDYNQNFAAKGMRFQRYLTVYKKDESNAYVLVSKPAGRTKIVAEALQKRQLANGSIILAEQYSQELLLLAQKENEDFKAEEYTAQLSLGKRAARRYY